jgi:hypothetical protein
VMSAEVKHCFEDDDIDDLAQKMADEHIRRMPVFNDKKRLVGIVSLTDLATSGNGLSTDILAMALSGICQGQRRRAPRPLKRQRPSRATPSNPACAGSRRRLSEYQFLAARRSHRSAWRRAAHPRPWRSRTRPGRRSRSGWDR